MYLKNIPRKNVSPKKIESNGAKIKKTKILWEKVSCNKSILKWRRRQKTQIKSYLYLTHNFQWAGERVCSRKAPLFWGSFKFLHFLRIYFRTLMWGQATKNCFF